MLTFNHPNRIVNSLSAHTFFVMSIESLKKFPEVTSKNIFGNFSIEDEIVSKLYHFAVYSCFLRDFIFCFMKQHL